MTAMIKPWLIWTAGFLAFPFAGLAGTAVAGRVDSPLAALSGGLVTGAVIGAAQVLCSSRRLDPLRWIVASAIGIGAGLLIGATTVGFATSLPDLALIGFLTGLALGAAQAVALPAPPRQRILWAVAIGPLWALGWSVTTLAGIDVAQQFTIFGVSGAVTVTASSGVLLYLLLPAPSVTPAPAVRRPHPQIGNPT
jgi:hypothetical protein